MCTLALYFRRSERFPLIVAANRDESFERPSEAPQIVCRSPLIAAGKDLLAGGTWLGWNEHGLVAGILNRRAETKPGMARSRGLLCLDVLSASDTIQARSILASQDGLDYNPFNLLIADSKRACIAYNNGPEIGCLELKQGLHVFGNDEVREARAGKSDSAHLLFSKIPETVIANDSLPSWVTALRAVLGNHDLPANPGDPSGAICVHTPRRGTVSSTLLFFDRDERRFYGYHAAGPPCRAAHEPSVSIGLR